MIRSYQPGDHEAIAEIFPRAIHETASEVYTKEQCNAWSERAPNPGHWEKRCEVTRCEVTRPFVFVIEGNIAGFLELDLDGHIDCMYVHPDHKRKGIASSLIDHAVRTSSDFGLRRVFVDASICAKPVFEKKEFRVIEEKTVEIRGEDLINFSMKLELTNAERANQIAPVVDSGRDPKEGSCG